MKLFEEKLPDYNVIGKDEIDGALEVLNTGQLSGFVASPGISHLGGKYVQKLEELFCDKFSLYGKRYWQQIICEELKIDRKFLYENSATIFNDIRLDKKKFEKINKKISETIFIRKLN